MLAACDSSPGSDNTEDDAKNLASASNPILLVVEPLGDDLTRVNYMDSDDQITICYEDGECDRWEAGGRGVAGIRNDIMRSDSGRTVIGVAVEARIKEDSGKLIVGESATAEVETPPKLSTVYHETDELEPGDNVSFEIGDVE